MIHNRNIYFTLQDSQAQHIATIRGGKNVYRSIVQACEEHFDATVKIIGSLEWNKEYPSFILNVEITVDGETPYLTDLKCERTWIYDFESPSNQEITS